MPLTLILNLVALCASVVMFARSIQVYLYRTRLRGAMHALDVTEIEAGGDGWRVDEMRRVSYNRMVWTFWRRPGSFYDLDGLRRPHADTARVV